MPVLRFVGYGIGFVLIPEFTNLVIINQMPGGYLGALLIYCTLLVVGYGIQKLIDRLFNGPVFSNILTILVFGLLGLALEWFVIGNSPWENPDAIQWGMFAYWVGLFMVPRILIDDRESVQGLSRRIKIVYLIYAILHLILALTLPSSLLIFVIPLLWTVVYTCFGGFYVRYIRLLKESNSVVEKKPNQVGHN